MRVERRGGASKKPDKQQAAIGRNLGGSGVSEAKGRERSQSRRVSEGQVHEA